MKKLNNNRTHNKIINHIKTWFIKNVSCHKKKLKTTVSYNDELKYYKCTLGFLPFNPKTFRSEYDTIEKVMNSEYYYHRIKTKKHEYEKAEELKFILFLNFLSKSTFEMFSK